MKISLSRTQLSFGGAHLGNLYRAISDDHARATVDAAWKERHARPAT